MSMAERFGEQDGDTFVIQRLPEDDDELWWFVYALWGYKIPRVRVCKGHVAPFEAFADAYFARHPTAVWKASRGFGGKSHTLGTLAITEAVLLGAQVNVLGGSGAQSMNIHEASQQAWYSPNAPRQLLNGEPTKYITRLRNGAWIKVLMASQRSVRGPHPQRLRLDEIDEMELAVLEASLGQPMDDRGIRSQLVMSSTHQYPDKTMTEMLKRAAEKNWPVYQWCYRESMGTKAEPGWLSKSMVEDKKIIIPNHMWDTEYELQEPSITGRAITTDNVEQMFDTALGHFDGALEEKLFFEKPIPELVQRDQYVTGVDWAKSQDYTVIWTYRTDVRPWKTVAFMRTGRKPWPAMVRDVDVRMKQYGGFLVHDATGVGDVVHDYLEYDETKTKGVGLRGRDRELIFSDYIAAIENDELKAPRIEYAYGEHRYVTTEDLYSTKGHPPDSFIAGALAWHGRQQHLIVVGPGGVSRDSSPWREYQ